MSLTTEIVTQGPQNGPALAATNGLSAAVNQSAAAAQHDPYAASYSPYPAVVNGGYGAPYSPAGVSSLAPSYYTQPPPAPPQQQQHGDQTPHDLHHEHPHLLHEQFPDSELRYTQQLEQHPAHAHHAHSHSHGHNHTHSQSHSRAHSSPHASPPPPPPPVAGPSGANGHAKRKDKASANGGGGSGDEGARPLKRRKPASRVFKDGDGEDDDVGPGGGAKHWSVEEKTRLFSWILEDDERWEMFGSKMNVVFREGSEKLFSSRKSFTALKSCYHRNLDVFKQIWLFEAFLTRPPPPPGSPRAQASSLPSPGTPSSSASASARDAADILHAPIPAAFAGPGERQQFLERKLEAARALEVPIANLSVKVIDGWQQRGWYTMFKRRFKADAKTGLPVPAHDGVPPPPAWCAIPAPWPKHAHAHEHAQSLGLESALGAGDEPGSPQADREPDGAEEQELDGGSVQSPHTPGLDAQRRQQQHFPDTGAAPYASPPKAVMSRASLPGRATPSPQAPSYVGAGANGHHALSHTPTPTSTGYAQPLHPSHAHPAPHAHTHTHTHTPYSHSAQSSPQLPATPYTYPPPAPHQHTHTQGPASASASTAAAAPFYPSPPAEYQAHAGAGAGTQHFQAQTLQALTHLTSVTQTLLGTCTALTELVRAQVEDSKVRTELYRRREEREAGEGAGGRSDAPGGGAQEGLGRTQKASLAMELLSNPGVGDEIKGVASDYLKKLFQ